MQDGGGDEGNFASTSAKKHAQPDGDLPDDHTLSKPGNQRWNNHPLFTLDSFLEFA